jgi:hypothetical protein
VYVDWSFHFPITERHLKHEENKSLKKWLHGLRDAQRLLTQAAQHGPSVTLGYNLSRAAIELGEAEAEMQALKHVNIALVMAREARKSRREKVQ